jgi:hypothetical protein
MTGGSSTLWAIFLGLAMTALNGIDGRERSALDGRGRATEGQWPNAGARTCRGPSRPWAGLVSFAMRAMMASV